MDEGIRKKIAEIIGQMRCPKDFSCVQSGFEVMCRARDIGLDTFLECLDEHGKECPFVVAFGDVFLCHCPLRVYLSRALQR